MLVKVQTNVHLFCSWIVGVSRTNRDILDATPVAVRSHVALNRALPALCCPPALPSTSPAPTLSAPSVLWKAKVASVAIGANYKQCVEAFAEAEKYETWRRNIYDYNMYIYKQLVYLLVYVHILYTYTPSISVSTYQYPHAMYDLSHLSNVYMMYMFDYVCTTMCMLHQVLHIYRVEKSYVYICICLTVIYIQYMFEFLQLPSTVPTCWMWGWTSAPDVLCPLHWTPLFQDRLG